MQERQQRYLAALEIPLWVERRPLSPEAGSLSADPSPPCPVVEPSPTLPAPSPCARPPEEERTAAWSRLQQQVATCHRCTELVTTRTQTVFGSGALTASLLIVGEAPGADEDRQGFPFVGKAGQLLTAMLAALGLSREEVYIANTLKCRPPENRNPHADEITACLPYLQQQIELLQPKVILALGRFAAQTLLQSSHTVGELRAHTHILPNTTIPVVVSYHPAYLLRSPLEKAKSWHDLTQLLPLLC